MSNRLASVDYGVTKTKRLLVQKEYKTWHDWLGKMIHKGLCKRMKFDNTTQ